MNKLLLVSTLAVVGLGLAVSGCDQQESSDSSSAPLQQQGAVPSDSPGGTTPMAPDTSEPQATAPESLPPAPAQPEALQPEPAPANSDQ